jgi:hapalindole H/12-epi-hapalindole U/12-epi-fischerindole U synthase
MDSEERIHIRHKAYQWLIFVVITLGYVNIVTAAPVAVVNPGFEDIAGESQINEFTFGSFTGWTLYDPDMGAGLGNSDPYFVGTLTPTEIGTSGTFVNFPGGAFEGERVALAFNREGSDVGNGGSEYGLEQLLVGSLQPSTQYTLEVAIGNIASGTSQGGTFFELSGFPGYRIELLAGGQVLAMDTNMALPIDDGEFGISTVSFTTGATHAQLGQALGIRLINTNVLDLDSPSSDLEVDFDAVSLSAVVVPIPAMLPLMALLMTGMALRPRVS